NRSRLKSPHGSAIPKVKKYISSYNKKSLAMLSLCVLCFGSWCAFTFKFGAGILQGIYEVGGKLYNLYQEILQGNHDSVEELEKTTSWIGEEFMEKLKSVEEKELISVRSVNAVRHAQIGRRKRQKFRAYFL
ncbi:hypothetical protein MKW98_025499, partial [Papaver atlanticum]